MIMRKYSVFFPAFFAFLLFACKKNLDQQANVPANNSFTVSEAKSWFNTTNQNQKSLSASKKNSNSFLKFRPLWEKAINDEDDKFFIVESPIIFDQAAGYLIGNRDESKVNSVARLLVLKSKQSGEVFSVLMHIYSDDGKPMHDITYTRRDKNFTGHIFFTDMGEEFVNGWQYKNGKIVKRSGKSAGNGHVSRMVEPDEGCSEIEFRVYKRTCFYDGGDETCTSWEYQYSFYGPYCSGTGTGSVELNETNYYTTIEPNSENALGMYSDEEDVDPNTGLITMNVGYKWKCGKGSTRILSNFYNWAYWSYETGVVEKVNANDLWKFQSLAHSSIQRIGQTPLMFEYTHELGYAVPNILSDRRAARMEIEFIVYQKIVGPGGLAQTRSWTVPAQTNCLAP